jgi:hypothetical protein
MQWPRDRWINGVMQPVSRQRIGKHVPAAMNTHATIVTLGNGIFCSARAKGYEEDNWGDPVSWGMSSAGRQRRDGAVVQLWDIRRTVTTWTQKLKNLHCWELLPSNNLWRHCRLEKTWRVVICKMWKSATALLNSCSSESCVKEINKSIHQSIPHLQWHP